MLNILTQEESERESGETGPCMEYLLHHKILETIYTLGKADCPPGMKQQVLSFYTKLLGCIRQPLLPHINVHRPVLIIQPTIRGDQWTKGWTMGRTEKTHGSHKKLPLIDGGSGRYHSAHLMKVHMDQIQTLKTEIESLKADQQKDKHYLRAEIRGTADALVQSQAVLAECHSSLTESQAALAESQAENDALKRARKEMESQSIPGTPVSSGTPPPTGTVNICGNICDISIFLLTTELDQLLTRHSEGCPDRYAVLLFQRCLTEERYHEWTQNTNCKCGSGCSSLKLSPEVSVRD
ncbi:uncharacterized protein LOC109876116 isoform X2 [Oncorhynchus kisutch]|uniref:uncharacterized protein LOC109876116 isoform X2 n=1 Tax=Oncorhynchus kisutch TaxID=8019 RepID=UPI0012DDE8E1|nr:uncharacterized protein LOC109876116 isoform X2 [Oncorhynchus kisutch]